MWLCVVVVVCWWLLVVVDGCWWLLVVVGGCVLLLVVGGCCWWLVVVGWLLVVGCWFLLVLGRWPLVVGGWWFVVGWWLVVQIARDCNENQRGGRGDIGFWSKSDPRRVDRNKSCASGSASISVGHGASTEDLTKTGGPHFH